MTSATTPSLNLQDVLASIGDAGQRMSEIAGAEGAAGNISVYFTGPAELEASFPNEERVEFSAAVPELSGGTLLVTGSGQRLREIGRDPTAHLACVIVHEGGKGATVRHSRARRYSRLTTELDSHLAVHADRIRVSRGRYHALVHAQPVHITYLTHVPRYRDADYLNRRLLRWQAETILNLPEGFGYVPFRVPGSAELVAETREAMRRHRIVIWGQHGLLSRSDCSVQAAADCIEYAETAAHYEYMNLVAGNWANGISPTELRDVCRAHGVKQSIF